MVISSKDVLRQALRFSLKKQNKTKQNKKQNKTKQNKQTNKQTHKTTTTMKLGNK